MLDVVETYQKALSGVANWQFVPEALTAHENNLRRSEVEMLFNSVGIVNCWKSISEHDGLVIAARNIDDNKPIDAVLESFVTYRNEASHGSPDDLLGRTSLKNWIPFCRELCSAVAMTVIQNVLVREKEKGTLHVYGEATEEFKNNTVVCKCRVGSFKKGSKLCFMRANSFVYAEILSLQLNDTDVEEVNLVGVDTEVGIRTSVPVKKGSQIVELPS